MSRYIIAFFVLILIILYLPGFSFGQRIIHPGVSITLTPSPTVILNVRRGTAPTDTPTPTPNNRRIGRCDSGLQTSPCTTLTPNSCILNNGTQTITYTTSSSGGSCIQTSKQQQCTIDACNTGYACRNATCINLNPTPIPFNGGNTYICQSSACVRVDPGKGLWSSSSCDGQGCSGHQVFGNVFQDKNGDGIAEPGEGLNGVTVKMNYTYTDGNPYVLSYKTVNFNGGNYWYDGFYGYSILPAYSNVSMSIDTTTLPSGYSLVSPETVNVDSNSDDTQVNWIVTTSSSQTPTPTTVTSSPIPNETITPTTNAIPTISLTPTPTGVPVPGDVVFNVKVGLDAIGTTGNNQNPTASNLSNKNPVHTIRNVTIEVYDQSNKLITTKPGSIIYDSNLGKFLGSIDVGNLASGDYTIKIKSDGYLKKLIPSIFSISSSMQSVTTINLPLVNLTAGDINGDNSISIADYSILLSCSIYTTDNGSLCNSSSVSKNLSDLNDDGAVDQIDYNLFLIEYSVQNGD